MDKIDYWFLDSAIEDVIGFSWIVPNKIGEIGINREPLNISIADMAFAMERLFQEGTMLAITPLDLNFLYFEEQKILNINLLNQKGYIPSLKEIKNALKQQDIEGIYNNEQLYYFLTTKGGKLWESFSYPKWEKKINYEIRERYIEVSGTNFTLIRRFIEKYHLFNYDSYNVTCPVLNTQIWNEIIPFQCVYWKSFPLGYKVNCQIRYEKVNRESINNNRKLLNQRKAANNWYRNLTKWYINYYDSDN